MEQTLVYLLYEYGYLAVFFCLVLGIVGLPIPDEVLMTFIGYLSSIEKMKLIPSFFSAYLGSLCGITVSYVLGERLGYPFLWKYGSKFFINRYRLKKTQQMFCKFGNWLLFFGYFIPGIRHLTAYMAGISKISYPRFALYAYSGAFVWCSTFIGLGYTLGNNWKIIFQVMHKYGMILLWILLPLVAIGISWYLWYQIQNDKPINTK